MAADREMEKSRFHAFVNGYVEHVCAEMTDQALTPEHEDFY